MVEWIREIRFIETEKTVGAGHGGVNEDDDFLMYCSIYMYRRPAIALSCDLVPLALAQ